MKKIVIFLTFLLFLAFVFFGYKAAANLFKGSTTELIKTQSNRGTSDLQRNYLLIQVDDLTTTNPQLISAWITFFYSSTPPQLMFIPIHPSTDSEIDKENVSAFQLLDGKKVSAKFLKNLQYIYKLTIDGYVVTDSIGYGNFILWMGGDPSKVNFLPAVTTEEKQTLLLNETSFLDNLCQLFKTGASNSFFSQIDWSAVLPDHFSTNLPFEELMLTIDQINRAPQILNCDILSPQ
jgi:hypothetical protein